jgi:hypothetical protein
MTVAESGNFPLADFPLTDFPKTRFNSFFIITSDYRATAIPPQISRVPIIHSEERLFFSPKLTHSASGNGSYVPYCSISGTIYPRYTLYLAWLDI